MRNGSGYAELMHFHAHRYQDPAVGWWVKQIPGYHDGQGAGDATPAYMGKLTKWVRHILFLRPGLFLLLDEIAAPSPSRFQWLMHALNEMEIRGQQIVSRRNKAKLEVHLACAQGLTLSQTDQFDTPYNHGIPEAYHREKANHWHVTAETNSDSKVSQIAAVMAVTNPRDRFEFRIQNLAGWFGVLAQGQFGQTASWIRYRRGFSQTQRHPQRRRQTLGPRPRRRNVRCLTRIVREQEIVNA